jgi:hypothetical protein
MNLPMLTLLQAPGPDHLLFQSDKAFALLAVVLIIFGGIVALLIRQERKLAKLEKMAADWADSASKPNTP